MRVGTKSLLFGVHQLFLHPVFVLIAWVKLYGWPRWWELAAIIGHDWGYWGCAAIDDPHGEEHPRRSAGLLYGAFGHHEMFMEVLCHSRHYSRRERREPSRLCWADKASHLYYPKWLYLLLARASGELAEYRRETATAGLLSLDASDDEWFDWMQDFFDAMVRERRGDAVPYINPLRTQR